LPRDAFDARRFWSYGVMRHARYESLAGAILLGEATPGERAEFIAHAQTCSTCRDDGGSLLPLRDIVADAAAREVWRPSIASGVRERVHQTQAAAGRRTLTTFAYAVGVSLALNVFFVSGFAGRALDAMRATPEYAYSAMQRISFERRPHPVVAAARPAAGPQRVVARVAATVVRSPAQSLAALRRTAAAEASNLLEGLALDAPGSRSVALRDPARCVGSVAPIGFERVPCTAPPLRGH